MSILSAKSIFNILASHLKEHYPIKFSRSEDVETGIREVEFTMKQSNWFSKYPANQYIGVALEHQDGGDVIKCSQYAYEEYAKKDPTGQYFLATQRNDGSLFRIWEDKKKDLRIPEKFTLKEGASAQEANEFRANIVLCLAGFMDVAPHTLNDKIMDRLEKEQESYLQVLEDDWNRQLVPNLDEL